MRVSVNKGTIQIRRGDIADAATEAIVNAANNHLWMGAGVAGAIKRKGGEAIEREAIAQGPVEIGRAVLTSGGTLAAKYVIHAAVMGQDLHTDAEKIRRAARSALSIAEQMKIGSVSFPALGTGVGGFSVFHCAKLLINEAVEFLQKADSLRLVEFVLFDEESFAAFEEELKLQFSAKRH